MWKVFEFTGLVLLVGKLGDFTRITLINRQVN